MKKTLLLLNLQHSAEDMTNTFVNTMRYNATGLSKLKEELKRYLLVLFLKITVPSLIHSHYQS